MLVFEGFRNIKVICTVFKLISAHTLLYKTYCTWVQYIPLEENLYLIEDGSYISWTSFEDTHSTLDHYCPEADLKISRKGVRVPRL